MLTPIAIVEVAYFNSSKIKKVKTGELKEYYAMEN